MEGLESSPINTEGWEKDLDKAAAQNVDDKKVISPVSAPVVSSEFGPRVAPKQGASTNHKGIDIVKADPGETSGAPVVAPVNGEITAITSENDGNGAGNRISIKANGDGKTHKFFHLQGGFGEGLSVGDQINRGTEIGNVGETGTATAPHLHYEVREADGTALNPRNENAGLTNAPTRSQLNKNASDKKNWGNSVWFNVN